jgi:hypothetical protein
MIAQVHENHATMVTPTVHPATQGDLPLKMRGVQLTTVNAAHGMDFL